MEHIVFDGEKVFCGNLCEKLELFNGLPTVENFKKVEIKNCSDEILPKIQSLGSDKTDFCFYDLKCIDTIDYLLENGVNVTLHTKCFDDNFAKFADKNLNVIFDIDCGSKEVGEKLGIDFNYAVQEIKKFDLSKIGLRYMINAGKNDTVEAVDEWLSLVRDMGINTICVDVENEYVIKNSPSEISAHILILSDYIEKSAKDFGLNIYQDEFLKKVLNCRKYPKSSYVMQFKELLKSVVAELTEKNLHKN